MGVDQSSIAGVRLAFCYRYIETPTIAWARDLGAAYARKSYGVT